MSAVTRGMTEPPAAVRAGADLRAARERLGWSLPEMAAELRIRLPHLEALEEGRISQLPGNAYAVAFMRSYARALGLDDEEMVRRFKAEVAEVGRRTELVFPIPMPQRGLPAGAILLLGIVLAIGAYTGWYRLSGEGRLPAETVVAIPERLAPLAEQALPPPPGRDLRRPRRLGWPSPRPRRRLSRSRAGRAAGSGRDRRRPVRRRRRRWPPVAADEPHRAPCQRGCLDHAEGPQRGGAAEPGAQGGRDLAGAAAAGLCC